VDEEEPREVGEDPAEREEREERAAELARAKAESSRRIVLAFASFLCTPIAPFVLFGALRALIRERRLGIKTGGSMAAAALSAFTTLYFLGMSAVAIALVVRVGYRDPRLVVYNGGGDLFDVRVDGRYVGPAAPGGHVRTDLEVGTHEVCAVRMGSGDTIACSTTWLDHRDFMVWNPESEGRFAVETVYYSTDSPRDATVEPLPRAEWHDVSGLDYVLEDPPQTVHTRRGSDERTVLRPSRSRPVMIVVDNPFDHDIEASVDDQVPLALAPGTPGTFHAREGRPHRIVVSYRGATLVDETHDLADRSATLLDPSGAEDYLFCREDEPPIRVQPTRWHDATDLDFVFDDLTPGAEWHVSDRWVVPASEGCGEY
jgi:hypothetical protein